LKEDEMRHQPFGIEDNPTDKKTDPWGGGTPPPQ
jgi:hypothetical protein